MVIVIFYLNVNMKYFFSLFIIVLFSIPVSGQLKIGAVAGLNNTRYVYKGTSKYIRKDRFDVVPDFRIGVLADVLLNKELYFQPALVYTRNSERSSDFYNSARTVGFSLSALELPLILIVKPVSRSKTNFFAGGGLVPVIVARARAKVSNYDKQGFVNQTIETIDDGYSLLAMAVRCEAGLEIYRNLSIQIYAQRGLTNMLSEEALQVKSLTYFNYGIGASCFFGSGKGSEATQKKKPRVERKTKMVRTAPRFRHGANQ